MKRPDLLQKYYHFIIVLFQQYSHGKNRAGIVETFCVCTSRCEPMCMGECVCVGVWVCLDACTIMGESSALGF